MLPTGRQYENNIKALHFTDSRIIYLTREVIFTPIDDVKMKTTVSGNIRIAPVREEMQKSDGLLFDVIELL